MTHAIASVGLPLINLVYLGRLDNQIKVLGHRVELGEVEAAMRQLSGLEGIVAIGWPTTEPTEFKFSWRLDCRWHLVCRISFDGGPKISVFSRTLLRDFLRIIRDASGNQSEVTRLLGGAEVLFTLFGSAESSSNPTGLLSGNRAYYTFVCERTESGYRRAVFGGEGLAVPGRPRSSASSWQGAMVAIICSRG
jgi:hypothetical protein